MTMEILTMVSFALFMLLWLAVALVVGCMVGRAFDVLAGEDDDE